MIPATADTYDVCIDDTYWRLASCDEWAGLRRLPPLKGVSWRDADATKHRLLAAYHETEAAAHRALATPQETTP